MTELAALSGITRATLGRLEQGGKCHASTLAKLERTYECPRFLFSDPDEALKVIRNGEFPTKLLKLSQDTYAEPTGPLLTRPDDQRTDDGPEATISTQETGTPAAGVEELTADDEPSDAVEDVTEDEPATAKDSDSVPPLATSASPTEPGPAEPEVEEPAAPTTDTEWIDSMPQTFDDTSIPKAAQRLYTYATRTDPNVVTMADGSRRPSRERLTQLADLWCADVTAGEDRAVYDQTYMKLRKALQL